MPDKFDGPRACRGLEYYPRDLLIISASLLPLLAFWSPLRLVIGSALHDDRYLQIFAAPFISSFLIFWDRANIFLQARYSPRIGILLLSIFLLMAAAFKYGAGSSDTIPIVAVVMTVLVWTAAFILRFGVLSFRAAVYPLSCLLLMIPVPSVWMNRIATALQHGSAAVSYELLKISGIPVLRHGMRFSLPGLEFEVAPECSGIRSSLALMMVALVTGYLCLRSRWLRAALLVLTLPIVVFKNAVRIAVLSTVGAYWDRAFLDGPVHHRYGGLLFSVVGVVLFVLLLRGLQILDRPRTHKFHVTEARQVA